MKNKLLIFLIMFGALHYSLAGKGGISFFLWPKFLKKTLPNNTLPNNNTLPPYLAPPKSPKSDGKPSSLARFLQEFPGSHFCFFQANVPLEAEKEKKEAGHEERAGRAHKKKGKKKVKTGEAKHFPLDAYKRSEEEERQRQEEEERQRQEEEDRQRQEEEDRQRQEAEARQRQEEEERQWQEEEERQWQEAEARQRQEEEARQRQEEEERQRQEEEARQRQEEEARQRQEEEERQRQEEEARQRQEEEARQRQEEEERQRQEEEARQRQEEEARQRQEEEERQRKEEEKKARVEKFKRLFLLGAEQKRKEEERQRKEAEKKARVEKFKRLFLLGAEQKRKEEEHKRKEVEEHKHKEEAEHKLNEVEEKESEKELIEEKLKLSSSFEKEGREHEYPFAPLFSSFPSSFEKEEKEYGDLFTPFFFSSSSSSSSSALLFVSENHEFSNTWHTSALSSSLSSSGEEFWRFGSDIGDIIDGDFSLSSSFSDPISPVVYPPDNEGMDKEAEESKEEEEKSIGVERFLKMQELITKISEDLQAEESVHLLNVQDKTKPVQLVAQHYESLLDNTEKLKWISNDKFADLEHRIRVSMRDMQLEYSEELKDNTCFLKNRSFATRQAYRGYDLSIPELYKNLLENAQTLAEYCRQQYEKNATIQERFTRIDVQEKQIEYPEHLQKFLSEMPGESSSKKKERLQKHPEDLEKQVIESRMALERTRATEQQVFEKRQDLRAKLSECEDVLKEAKDKLTNAEDRIEQIQGNLSLIYKDLCDPLAKLILNHKSENWLAFGALLKENTGITLPNPPSREDIDKELSAYLSNLILLAYNDRVEKLVEFLELIHWKGQALELDAKLTKVVKANEALQQERQKKEKLQEKCATYKQQRDEIKKDMEDNGEDLARLRIETEKHRALVAEHAFKVAEWKSISTSILSCDEKKKPEDIGKDIVEKKKELETLQLVVPEIEKVRDQVNRAVLKITEDWEAYEEKNKAHHGMIGTFRTAQKKLKALESNLSRFISRVPKACPLSEYGQVSEKLDKFFLECDRQLETILPSGFPEDPLHRVAMSYQAWKGAYTPVTEWEGLERKADVYTSATFKASEALKEMYN